MSLSPEYIQRQLCRLAHPDQVQRATYRLLSHLQEAHRTIKGPERIVIRPRIEDFLAAGEEFSAEEVAAIVSVSAQGLPRFHAWACQYRKQFVRLQLIPQPSAHLLGCSLQASCISVPGLPSLADRLVSHEDGQQFSVLEMAAIISTAVSSAMA